MTKPTLAWERMPDASWAVYVVGGPPAYQAVSPRGQAPLRAARMPTLSKVLFTIVRPARGANGLVDESKGWIVGGRNFDVATVVPTIDDARNRVEALFALEYDSLP